MKKIVVIPVKNEEWILEKTLACHSLWADHIIVADQNSTDSTSDICKNFSKVVYIKNSEASFNEGQRRQLLLDAARQFDGQNLIFALDADEIVTADIMEEKVWESLLALIRPGMSVELPWIQLWRNPRVFRNDGSVWSKSLKPFVYWDDRTMSFGPGEIHLSRVPEAAARNAAVFDQINVLHYQFVTWSRMLSKQRFYRVLEKVMDPKQSGWKINYRYGITKKENNLRLSPLPNAWISAYQRQGIDLANFPESDLYWYDIEVLAFFKKFGLDKFAWLDIWDTDWEQKRKLAANFKNADFGEKIQDPRNFIIKLYHKALTLS